MGNIGDRLLLRQGPPALPARDVDVDVDVAEDLARERELQAWLRRTPARVLPVLDETTELVLRACLSGPAGPREAG